jgi:quaternary ammonium compound-resistance protein SugE
VKPWTWVLVGGVFETAWALCMKLSDGFTDVFWTIATITFLFISVGLLNIGLIRGVPVSGGYTVWVGIGAVGSIVMGILIFGESFQLTRLLFAAIIIIGIVGVELTTPSTSEGPNHKS